MDELELLWGELGCMCLGPSIGFLERALELGARFLCRVSAGKDGTIVYIPCGVCVDRVAALYQISVIQDEKDRA